MTGRPRALVQCGGLLGAACSRTQDARDLSTVAAAGARLTLATDDGADTLASVERHRLPDLYYRVTLAPAPVGVELPLQCDWIDPGGRVRPPEPLPDPSHRPGVVAHLVPPPAGCRRRHRALAGPDESGRADAQRDGVRPAVTR